MAIFGGLVKITADFGGLEEILVVRGNNGVKI
jgi:hypothetical protein